MSQKFELLTVGGLPEDQTVAKEIYEGFYNRQNETLPEEIMLDLEKNELEKNKTEELAIIFANQAINEYVKGLGLEPKKDLPIENYRIIKRDFYKQICEKGGREENAGVAVPHFAMIILNEDYRDRSLAMTDVILHESLHMKSYYAQQVWSENDQVVSKGYRSGLAAESSRLKNQEGLEHCHFEGLNEAVLAKIEKELFQKALTEPFLAQEFEKLNQAEALKNKQEIIDREKIPADEFICFDREDGQINFFSYFKQRQVLDYAVDKIFAKKADVFENKEEVFKVFARAFFTGKYLELAHLFEDVFGKNSFRALGDMKTDDESAVLTGELLRSMASLIIKK